MEFINRIDGALAWIRQSGIYRQTEVYRRGQFLFAKVGSGYVRLGISGATSHPKITWMEIDAAGEPLDIRDGTMPTYIPAIPPPATKPRR